MSKDLKNNIEISVSQFDWTRIFRGSDKSRNGKVRQLPLTRSALLNTPGLSAFSGTPSQDGIFRIANVNYYLELREASKEEPLMVIGFPFDPNLINIDTPSNVQITHALGSTTREVTENNMRTITIQGQSGYAPRLGFARDGGYCFESGEILMEEFEEFLNAYNYLLYKTSNSKFHDFTGKGIVYSHNKNGNQIDTGYKTVKAAAQKYFLTLRCVNENIRYRVEPVQFTMNKDAARNKFGYNYTLVLNGYGIHGIGKRDNIFKDVLDNASAYISLAALAAAFAESIVLNINEDYINPLRGPLIAINNTLNQIENLFGTTGAVANNAINLIFEVGETLANINYTIKDIQTTATSQFDNINANLTQQKFSGWNADKLNQDTTTAFRGNRLPDNEYSLEDLANEPFAPQQFGLRVKQNASVKEKKDLNKVVDMLTNFDFNQQLEDKTNDLAVLVASLNSLNYNIEGLLSLIPKDFEPNQIDTSLKGFDRRLNLTELENDEGLFSVYELKEGENLYSVARKLFGNNNAVDNLITINGWLDAQRRGDGTLCDTGDLIKIPSDNLNSIFNNNGLGVDLACPQTTLSLNTTLNDVHMVFEENNMLQAIKNALLTSPGELRSAINFGVANVLGAKNLEYVKTIINDKLLADERLSQVQFNDIYIDKDTAIVDLTILTINRRNLNIRTSINI